MDPHPPQCEDGGHSRDLREKQRLLALPDDAFWDVAVMAIRRLPALALADALVEGSAPDITLFERLRAARLSPACIVRGYYGAAVGAVSKSMKNWLPLPLGGLGAGLGPGLVDADGVPMPFYPAPVLPPVSSFGFARTTAAAREDALPVDPRLVYRDQQPFPTHVRRTPHRRPPPAAATPEAAARAHRNPLPPSRQEPGTRWQWGTPQARPGW